MKSRKVIIVHGGAGKRRTGIISARKGVIRAVETGHQRLKEGGSAVEAVCAAVVALEDNPVFNAGIGSSLNLAGFVEMDASIMDDKMRYGAVAAIREVKNPILVARKVMEETDHIILAGEGAVRFAQHFDFETTDLITKRRKRQWLSYRDKIKTGKGHRYFQKVRRYLGYLDTVGAVALDSHGRLAAATSSGGILLRLPGRVGDSAIIGGGTYCNKIGAVSTTGHGEEIAKLLLARYAVANLSRYCAEEAARRTIRLAYKANCLCGLIVLKRSGGFATGENTGYLAWAAIKDGELFHF